MAKVSDIEHDLDTLKGDVGKLRDHTVKLASRVAEFGKCKVDSAMDTSKMAVKNAAKTIEKNPGMALAGAVGVGVVLGGMVKRLFRRKR